MLARVVVVAILAKLLSVATSVAVNCFVLTGVVVTSSVLVIISDVTPVSIEPEVISGVVLFSAAAVISKVLKTSVVVPPKMSIFVVFASLDLEVTAIVAVATAVYGCSVVISLVVVPAVVAGGTSCAAVVSAAICRSLELTDMPGTIVVATVVNVVLSVVKSVVAVVSGVILVLFSLVVFFDVTAASSRSEVATSLVVAVADVVVFSFVVISVSTSCLLEL